MNTLFNYFSRNSISTHYILMHAVFHYTGHRGDKPASIGTTLT